MSNQETCPYCGKPVGNDLRERLVCPICSRDGCLHCMSAGRNCMCPECEENHGDYGNHNW